MSQIESHKGYDQPVLVPSNYYDPVHQFIRGYIKGCMYWWEIWLIYIIIMMNNGGNALHGRNSSNKCNEEKFNM